MRLAAFAVLTCVVISGASVQSLAQSQSKSQTDTKLSTEVSKVKTACQSDLDKFCKGITPGGGRIAACLDSRDDQLSSPCKTAYMNTKERISEKMDKAELAFRNSCGADVRKFCSQVPSGKGRLLECLDEHRDNLSGPCTDFQASLEYQLSTLLG